MSRTILAATAALLIANAGLAFAQTMAPQNNMGNAMGNAQGSAMTHDTMGPNSMGNGMTHDTMGPSTKMTKKCPPKKMDTMSHNSMTHDTMAPNAMNNGMSHSSTP